jgi:hypothetical protein
MKAQKIETLERLKQELTTPVEASESWLQNQYPARPDKRYAQTTYLNYQNLEDLFGAEARHRIEQAVKEHPDVKVVIVAELTKTGRLKGPRSFIENEAEYYGQYELFAVAAHMGGFVEAFHNFESKN